MKFLSVVLFISLARITWAQMRSKRAETVRAREIETSPVSLPFASARKHIQNEKRRESLREKRLQAKAAEPLEQTVQFPPVETHSDKKSSRYNSVDVKHAVTKRDQCQCTFVAADGKRCSETRNLQFDHVRPHALGGKSSAENLRLLCPAQQAYG